MPRVIIKTGYTCNNNCIFCHAKDKKCPDLELSDIERKISKAKKLNADMVILSGGEPTIRKDFFSIAGFIKRNGLGIGLITNGRMLCYKDFLDRLCKYGLGYAYISLHGSNEKIHNRLVGTESFRQTLEGIRNVSGKPIELVVNCVITRYNLNDMERIIDVLRDIRTDKIKFSFIEPTGNNLRAVPDMKTAASRALNAIEYGKRMGLNVSIDGFPMCLIKGYEKRIDNLKTNNIRYISEAFENDFFPSDSGNTVKLEICRECSRMDDCPGIYRRYQKSVVMRPFV